MSPFKGKYYNESTLTMGCIIKMNISMYFTGNWGILLRLSYNHLMLDFPELMLDRITEMIHVKISGLSNQTNSLIMQQQYFELGYCHKNLYNSFTDILLGIVKCENIDNNKNNNNMCYRCTSELLR